MSNEGKGYLALVTFQRLPFFESFILQQLLYQTHVIFNESSSELPSYIEQQQTFDLFNQPQVSS